MIPIIILYGGMIYPYKNNDVGSTSEYMYDIKYCLPRMVMLYGRLTPGKNFSINKFNGFYC